MLISDDAGIETIIWPPIILNQMTGIDWQPIIQRNKNHDQVETNAKITVHIRNLIFIHVQL